MPWARNSRLEFELIVVIRLAVILISELLNVAATTSPAITASPAIIVLFTVRLFCNTTDDVGNTICPVPAALNSKSAFDAVVVIDPCDTVIVSSCASTVAEIFPVRSTPLEMFRSPV